METIKLTTQIDDTGTLRLELPAQWANRAVDVLVVLHSTTEQGWPSNYFDAIDAIDADDMLERPDQGVFEERAALE
ncbi:MAG: hypothetical protein L0154_09970 [Chloroflexi bacterium]|nr:hypothetical protein [Chloroflexota bacterium]